MADEPKQEPTGGASFDALARKLVQAPKRELDRAEKRYQKRKKQKRRKK